MPFSFRLISSGRGSSFIFFLPFVLFRPLAFERLISDGVLPDIPDTSLENKLHALTVDDGKSDSEATDAKQTMKLKKFMRLYQSTNVDLGTRFIPSFPLL